MTFPPRLTTRSDFSSVSPDLQIERVDASGADLDQDVTNTQLRYCDIDFVDTVAFALSLEHKCLHRILRALLFAPGRHTAQVIGAVPGDRRARRVQGSELGGGQGDRQRAEVLLDS